MKRQTLIRPLATVALIAAGAMIEHGLTSPTSAPSAAAAGTTPAATTRTTAAATDALTEHAFAVASPAVVYVDSVGLGSGSGVIYDATGDIVTNAHVVSGAQKLTVTLSSGKTYSAKLVGTDTADDLAVIHINASGLPAARFATAGSYTVAQTVLAIGNPLDLQQSVTSGLISALGRTVQESNGAYLPNALQTSAPINPGNSGGALVTLDGTVVGIPTLEATDPQNNNGGAAQGIGFAVPSDRVTYIARQLITSGKVAHTGRAYLGVAAVDAQQAQSLQGSGGYFGSGGGFGPGGQGSPATPSQTGALVQNASGPAAQAGVQQGDVITAFNGTSITGQNDLLTALAHQKPGATVTLTVDRNGSTSSIHVTLGELPANPS
jgi:S1-C subfamily serine protease